MDFYYYKPPVIFRQKLNKVIENIWFRLLFSCKNLKLNS